MTSRWTTGNRFELLENGEAFFPAAFAAIENARSEVLLETFILYEDKVGLALHAVLCEAARRGVQVDVTVDAYGSSGLSEAFLSGLKSAGARLHVFDPTRRLWGRRAVPFRRLHRKLLVVDGEVGFVGGINFSADHLMDFGAEAKQDYAVRARGPIVQEIRRLARETLHLEPVSAQRFGAPPTDAQDGLAAMVVRDNRHHRDDIERHYRLALRTARREVIIANAYFYPGYRLIRALRRAARRGVQVHLVLQGQPDMAWAAFFARTLYQHLISAGVRVHEYCARPMHSKVAVVDEDWATVGSSNLDPLSLWLNLEANVVMRDRAFAAVLRGHLQQLMRENCREMSRHATALQRWWWRLGLETLAFHVLRHLPAWAARLPQHLPQVAPAGENIRGANAPGEPVQPWRWRDLVQGPSS